MIVFSVIRLKVGVILLDYQLFINHAPHTHRIKHRITHHSTHLSTRFVAATVSSFEATFPFYPLPFEKHITFSQNYDYLTNTEELIIPKFMKLTEFTTSPSMAEVKYK